MFSSVLETKTTVDSSECRVRSLQMSILCELKQLQQYLNVMEEQFKEIEVSVKNSSDIDESNLNLRHFKEKIISVSSDIRSFQAGLTQRVIVNDSGTLLPGLNRSFVKTELDDGNELAEEESEDLNSGTKSNWMEEFIRTFPIQTSLPSTILSTRGKQASKKKTTKQRTRKLQTKQNGKAARKKTLPPEIPPEKSLLDETFKQENNNFPELEPGEIDYSPVISPQTSNNFESDDENSSNNVLSRGKRKRRSCFKALSKMKTFSKVSDSEEEFQETDSDYEPPDEYEKPNKPSTSPHMRKKRKVVDESFVRASDPLENVDLSEMEPFKRCMVLMLLTRPPVYISENEDEEEALPNTPEHRVKEFEEEMKHTWFEYNRETNGVHYKGMDVVINEEDKSLECSVCPFKVIFEWPPETRGDSETNKTLRKFTKHLPLHYMGYECPFCPPRANSGTAKPFNCKTYLHHLKGHLRKQRFLCEICSKGWQTRRGLEKHILSHKTKEEREEVEKSKRGDFLCEFCPKSFKNQMSLTGHVRMAHPERIPKVEPLPTKKPRIPQGRIGREKISLHTKLKILEVHFQHPTWKIETLGKSLYRDLSYSSLYNWKKKLGHYFKDGVRLQDPEVIKELQKQKRMRIANYTRNKNKEDQVGQEGVDADNVKESNGDEEMVNQ